MRARKINNFENSKYSRARRKRKKLTLFAVIFDRLFSPHEPHRSREPSAANKMTIIRFFNYTRKTGGDRGKNQQALHPPTEKKTNINEQ